VPKKPADFADGGAYPECHVAQYPLGMGKAPLGGGGGSGTASGAGPSSAAAGTTLAVAVKADGQLSYEALLRQGGRSDAIIHEGHQALVPKIDMILNPEETLRRPDADEEARVARETQAALAARLEGKLAATRATTLPAKPGAAQYVRYTPADASAQHGSGAAQRIVKVVELPKDPLQPPKFRSTKAPRGAPDAPVPILHSPPRAPTAQDQADWKIPPCVSNWKNAKGYTIPLDKRLAADGRGLQETVISDKFAGLSEALLVAEAKAREAVEMRARVQREVALRTKEAKEAELRELAMAARAERVGGGGGGGGGGQDYYPPPPPAAAAAAAAGPAAAEEDDDDEALAERSYADRERARAGGGGGGGERRQRREDDEGYPPPPPPPRNQDREDEEWARRQGREAREEEEEEEEEGEKRARRGAAEDEDETPEEREARRRRDEIREERRRERERERRLEAAGGSGAAAKRGRLARDRERDVGERMALGMAAPGGAAGGGAEVQYDARLFNQEQGLQAGFGAEDSYAVYDRPLFAQRDGRAMYRAPAGGGGGAAGEGDEGAAAAAAAGGGKKGGGALEYEAAPGAAVQDPFGLDSFLSEVGGRGGERGGGRALEGIGKRGGMGAAGGGGGGGGGADGGGGRRTEFVPGDN
jgi:SNW domain-containing protein 1